MSTNLTHEKSILSNHQRKTRELQNRLDIITNLERDLRDLIELSRGIAERRNKLGEAERTKASTIARLDQKKIDLTSLDAKLAVSWFQSGRGISTYIFSNSIVLSRMQKTNFVVKLPQRKKCEQQLKRKSHLSRMSECYLFQYRP
jgi:hypothetical protein